MDYAEIKEKELRPAGGILMLTLNIIGILVSFGLIIVGPMLLDRSAALGISMLIGGLLLLIFFSLLFAGLRAVRPNEALVLTLFGSYHGTISRPGFFFVHPFSVAVNPAYEAAKAEAMQKAAAGEQKKSGAARPMPRKAVSTKTMTLLNGTQKVNDVLGNPIIIAAVVLWKVKNPTKAVFNVENYAEYLSTQTDSTIRNIARLYPYDNMDADSTGEIEQTLRGSAQEIAGKMQNELQERVTGAGLSIEDVRITHLSYAEEIAAAMLQRQQADAIIAARQKIVDGAVGMVKMAIEKLGEEEIVMLDEERKAAMVSNLLVVLCGNKDAQPIVNTGSLY